MKVLFVCVQGLSSAIVVSSLKKQAKKENIDMDILAVSIREFEKEIENGCNLAVIAPQVMNKYDYLSKISNERGIPCVLVDK
ncbi:MAG: PTS sugar transporter subunit IIB, partial [Clostridium sp.]